MTDIHDLAYSPENLKQLTRKQLETQLELLELCKDCDKRSDGELFKGINTEAHIENIKTAIKNLDMVEGTHGSRKHNNRK